MGIPRHDTIERVIFRLKADAIEGVFQSWISSLIESTGADIIVQLLIDKSRLAKDYQWSGLKSIIKVTAQVHDKTAGTYTAETRWYISSLYLNTAQAINGARSHWQVEICIGC